MRIETTITTGGARLRDLPTLRAEPGLRSRPADLDRTSAVPAAPADDGLTVRRLIGDVDVRHASPRQMAETSLDLYVAGILPWEEYAMLAFQAELHPDYDKTIGALTGEKAQPDRPRDFLSVWEERLTFEEKYNADRPQLVARTRRIVQVFRQLSRPLDLVA